jgi:sugar (pentulose or hexulose) kinase
MSAELFVGIDVGTSGVQAIAIDLKGYVQGAGGTAAAGGTT